MTKRRTKARYACFTFPSPTPNKGHRSVPSVLTGAKSTQWRVITPQPPEGSELAGIGSGICKFTKPDGDGFFVTSPYQVGQICYVRETWGIDANGNYCYFDKDPAAGPPGGWQRMMTMPPQAARIFIRITEIRCGRLQSMTATDWRREGFPGLRREDRRSTWGSYASAATLADGGHWKDNPWMWIISFELCPEPNDFMDQAWSEESVQRAASTHYVNQYEVRIRATGELVAAGTAEQIAKAMGRTTHAIYEMRRKSRINDAYLYLVEPIDTGCGKCRKGGGAP